MDVALEKWVNANDKMGALAALTMETDDGTEEEPTLFEAWTKQKWRTKSGKPSTQGSKATGEIFTEKAIKALSAKEYAATTRAKRKATRRVNRWRSSLKIAKKTRAYRKTS